MILVVKRAHSPRSEYLQVQTARWIQVTIPSVAPQWPTLRGRYSTAGAGSHSETPWKGGPIRQHTARHFVECVCGVPLHQGFSILVPESPYPACFRCFPAPAHLIQMNGHYPASTELDNNPFIWIRCAGAGKHPEHAGQWALRARVEDH